MNVFQIHITDGESDLPPILQATTQHVRRLHPDDHYEICNGPRLRSFIEQHYEPDVLRAYDRLKPYAFKADLGRLCLVHQTGGLYIDLAIHLLAPVRPADDVKAILFRDFNLTLPYGWGVSNSFFYARAGARFLRKAIDLIVDNCRTAEYGATPFSVTGPAVFGRALAETGEDSSFVIGDRTPLTPLHPRKNFAFIMPDGSIAAWAKQRGHGGDMTTYGEQYGNNYMEMWKARDVFHETF